MVTNQINSDLSDRFDSYLVIGKQSEILANIILEHYTPEVAVLHFCVFKINDINWFDYYNEIFKPSLPDTIEHIVIPFKSTSKARIRRFESWGFEFEYKEEEDLYVFHDSL